LQFRAKKHSERIKQKRAKPTQFLC